MTTIKHVLTITALLVCTGLCATSAFAASSNLGITKTDGLTTVVAGSPITYTIVVTNLAGAGLSAATNANMKDNLDGTKLSACTWTCSVSPVAAGNSCPASGAGDIDDKTLDLKVGATATYKVNCTVLASASGTLSNTATIAVTGAGNSDPVAGNNSATDTTTITVPPADLSITKDDGVTSAFAGGAVTYTIVASNAGPNAVATANITDTFPATLTCTWTCSASAGGTCAASGSGSINDANRTIPSGGKLTYTAQCGIAANATGNLINIATITSTAPDPVATNNTATDTDTISQPIADLSITKTDGVTSVTQGGSVTYTIVASNAGPDPVGNAHVTDTFPAGLTCTWTCVGASGGVCSAASGSGSINASNLIIAAGGKLTYSTVCAVAANATGTLVNTATISATATDPASGNNNASDSDKVNSAQLPSAGNIIFDMTFNPTDTAISTNLVLFTPGTKGDSAIDNGYGGNAINIDDFQVLFRDVYQDPNGLKLVIGNTEATALDDQFGCGTDSVDPNCKGKTQNNQFAEGGHLFDLDRLRAIADWMSTNTTAIQTTLPTGTYGTISYAQLISNIVNNRTMYGVVRVKVPLQACPGATNCPATSTALNAMGQTVAASTLYGLCKTKTGLCSCGAGASDIATTVDIAAGKTICSMAIPQNVAPPNNNKIKVKGTMMWDFVDSTTGAPIPLERLPWAPRDLYFKVIIPIVVNGDYDLNDDGAMDNMLYIQTLSANKTPGTITPTIDYAKIPDSTKADFLYYTGEVLTSTKFGTLDKPTQYHMLMANGYPSGWVEAFTKLGISRSEWTSIPGVSPPLGMPTGGATITEDDVRSPSFEDIPAYLYTGGLIDMHDQVNISGLIYVPQGMELEAKNGSNASPQPTRQYVIGAIVVRDSFYLEAKVGATATVISSEPAIYSTAQISAAAAASSNARDMVFGSSVASSTTISGDGGGDGGDGGPVTVPGTCYTGCGLSSSSSHPPGASRWIEVRPESNN